MEFSKFVDQYPSHQAAVDIFSGQWASQLPDISGPLVAGSAALFEGDSRPSIAAKEFGDAFGRLDGLQVCELGPLEAGHTYQLEKLGASVVAIEGNAEAYLKCLIVKEIFDLKSKFYLGNFLPFLEKVENKFDIIFASGVLYHMAEPLRLIELICKRTKNCFLWSHYYDSELCPGYEERRSSSDEWSVPHFHLAYGDRMNGDFLGGLNDSRCWLRRDDIIAAFQHYGHEIVNVVEEDRGHPYGPCFSLVTKAA